MNNAAQGQDPGTWLIILAITLFLLVMSAIARRVPREGPATSAALVRCWLLQHPPAHHWNDEPEVIRRARTVAQQLLILNDPSAAHYALDEPPEPVPLHHLAVFLMQLDTLRDRVTAIGAYVEKLRAGIGCDVETGLMLAQWMADAARFLNRGTGQQPKDGSALQELILRANALLRPHAAQ